MDHELLLARELQLGMVPPDFAAPDGTVATHLLLEPARQVGGDLCDCFPGRGDMWLAIMPAAMPRRQSFSGPHLE
jgi:hypothetical protein